MRWLVGWGLRNRRPVVGVAVILLLVGIWQFPKLHRDVLPEFAPTTVEVQTEALGLSATEVEQLITVPLEQDLLNGVAWLDSIRSKSVPGLSSIEMIFEPGTPVLKARQVIQERLTQAHALPNVSKPPQMLQPVSSASRVMMVGISSEKLTPIELGVLARWTLRPNLLGVDGVSNVAIFGQRERQLQVQVDPAKLAEKNVGLDQIIESTGNALWVSPLTYLEASTPGAGGFIESPNQRLTVQHESPIVNAEQLGKVAIEGTDGLTLADVTTVVEDHQPLIGEAIFGADTGLLLVVEKYPGHSTSAVTDRVQDALDLLSPGLTDVKVDSEIYQPARYVDRSIDNLRTAVVIGAIIGAILLLGLALEWRTALIVALGTAASGAAAMFVLYVRQVTLNSMVIAGFLLATAFVVDQMVSATTAMGSRMRRAGNGGESTTPISRIRDGITDVMSPSLYAVAITIVVAIPLLLVDGLAGESFFPAIARSYILAIVAGLLVSALVVPALGVMLFGRSPVAPAEPRVARIVGDKYAGMAGGFVSKASPALIGLAVMLVVGVLGFTQLDSRTVPRFLETDLLVKVEGSPGTSLEAMERVVTKMNAEIQEVEGVSRVGSHIGRAITSDQVASVNEGELWIRVDEDSDYYGTISDLNRVIASYPGVRTDLTTYTGARLEQVLDPDLAPITVRVYGEEATAPAPGQPKVDVLRQKAEEIAASISGISGVQNARVKLAPVEPNVQIEVDLVKAQEAGVLPGDVRRAAATLLQGLEVGNLFENQKVFEVIVLGTPDLRSSVSTVQDLMIDAPDGKQVRLGDIANVSVSATANVINRDASQRFIDVVANVDGSVDSASEAVDKAIKAISYPLNTHAELLGDYQDHRDAVRRVWITALLAAVIILLVLQAASASWTLALLLLLSLPAAALGGVIVTLIDGGDLTIGHIAGLVGVLGLATRNAATIARRAQLAELDDPTPGKAAIMAAVARERAGSLVISTVATIGALIPIALLANSAGGEIVSPMAFVMIGGLITSLVVGLWIVPALCLRFAPDARANQLFVDEHGNVLASGAVHA